MVSLVNFKLMPEDNKSHDQELAISSSLSSMQTTLSKKLSHHVDNNNITTSNNEFIPTNNTRRYTHTNTNNMYYNKPPTPPKPHNLSTANDSANVSSSDQSIMLSSCKTSLAADPSSKQDSVIVDNGYCTQTQQNIVVMSPSENHHINNQCTVNHQQSDLVNQLQQTNQQQHNDELMINVAKPISSGGRHQRQASICGNIHQAYCVKVASPMAIASMVVNNNNNNNNNNNINDNDRYNVAAVTGVSQADKKILSATKVNINHQLESPMKPNNTTQQEQQQLVAPINQQMDELYEQQQQQQHNQQVIASDACKNNQTPANLAISKESSRIDTIRDNCLNNHASSELDKSKHLLDKASDRSGRFFTVTWRDLSFVIQPKWRYHSSSNKKSESLQNRGNNTALPVNLSPADSATNLESNNCQTTASSASILKSNLLIKNLKQTKVVLDSLDGCFKSGELTAILGPSGAGKTTLLDCLTGHRKQGLSGSIKIRSSPEQSLSTNNDSLCCYSDGKFITLDQKHLQDQQKLSMQAASQGNTRRNFNDDNTNNNLKVSIIPQNDHLIGHLTVYETLSYASKMKNCFDRKFDHKSNIERVSQQLGLLSCLSTRINKLSGGQYKRVSIAQELLSNPDILILDEPTSGLDAMTCYQTVQVLRRLADNRQLTNNQIAIILTIHQPNSDVFQQFNHVYVVAQGGKSIYEGPPSGIVSVIQKVGLTMPSINYNPATMIVEIAAGKFGYDSITKLNKIQKKQYHRNNHYDNQQQSDDDLDCCCSDSHNSSGDDEKDKYATRDGQKKREKRKDKKRETRGKNKTGDSIRIDNNNENNNKFNQDDNNNIENNDIDAISTSAGQGIINKAFQSDYEKDHNVLSNVVIVDASQLMVSQSPLASQEPYRRGGGGGGGNDHNGKGNNNNNNRKKNRRRPNKAVDSGKRLKLNSLKADQKFPFWRHTYLHFHRSWLSIVRDPMLCGMQLFLHIIIPIMVSMVYGPNVGQPNACPRAGPMDLITFALEPEDSTLNLQEELRTTLENIGYIFFKLYGIIFAAMTVTVLTFPLDMHVLVKEFRNGWYGLSSYFLGRTLADIPFQLTLPFLAMSLSYYATGQPYSYLQWRFMSITAILILSSLIAQSQGLLFGAILMDKMKAAVFVAPAATTPIILFAGFLVRTQSIPYYLRPLSNLSYLRYAIEACLISRYGFNQCECDPAIFNQTVPELPPIARTMLDYWLSSFKAEQQQQNSNNFPLLASSNSTDLTSDNNSTSLSLFSNNSTSLLSNNTSNGTIVYNSNLTAITTTSSPLHQTDDYVGGAAAVASNNQPDLFTKLIDSLAKANSFGRNITSCDQVVPYPMIDYNLKDSQLFDCFAVLLFMLIFTRFLTFFIVSYKVKRKV